MTEIEQRRSRASSQLAAHRVDALLVSSPANVRYLSGYSGSNALLLLTPDGDHFITDPRYAEASATITCNVHVSRRVLIKAAASIIKRKRLRKIGFEPSWLNVDQFERLKEAAPAPVSLHPLKGFVEQLRAIKSSKEIAVIRRSVEANSEAFRRIIRRVRPGQTEADVAAELDHQMRLLGAEKPAFDTIVAAGARSALPHAQPTAHRLQMDELLLVDMGAILEGYASDMTRVAYLGDPPQKVRDLYSAVSEAQQAAIDAVRPGVAVNQVDSAAREVLKHHQLDREFVHSTGHGLGLEIHEGPRIGKKEKTRLQAGMAITIEPGAYIPGLGGVRIEDTVLVTNTGCEVLTPTPKEFISL